MNEPMLAIAGLPGWLEFSVILLVALLLFGNRLPGIARSMGQSLIQFKRGLRSVEGAEVSNGIPSKDNK